MTKELELDIYGTRLGREIYQLEQKIKSEDNRELAARLLIRLHELYNLRRE